MFNEGGDDTFVCGEKYRRLESIFSAEEDIAFLQSEPGYHPRIGRSHRAAKRKLAFRWIRELQQDFNAVYDEGSLLLVHSDRDRSDLLLALLRLKFTFWKRAHFLRLRIWFNPPVFHEIRQLTTALEQMIGYCCILQHDSVAAGIES